MDLKVQKRLAAVVLDCSPKRVIFNPKELVKIKDAITKADIAGLINSNIITKRPVKGISRFHAKHRKGQRLKGRQKGTGLRKGTKNARNPRKLVWMNKIRLQRSFLKLLRDKEAVSIPIYHELYLKAKGGFFRSKRHIQLYLDERKLLLKKNVK